MIKYYYMKSLVKVADDEHITANQVRTHLSNGFRAMRLAYSPMFRRGLHFDSAAVLRNMAESSGITYEELYDTLQQYITDGLASEDRAYWTRLADGRAATPVDLVSFLWAKFEADIVPMHCWDLFGTAHDIKGE